MSKNESERIEQALDLAYRYGGIDEDHHRKWLIDQMVRALAGKEYKKFIRKYNRYLPAWDVGIAP